MSYQEQRYSLGFPEMDSQHQYLYQLFDALEPVFVSGNIAKEKKLMHDLEQYIMFHFECEEHLMRIYDTPGFAVHQSDHERVQHKLLQFLDDFEAGRLNPGAMRIFFTGWLMEHSQIIDSEYVKWIVECREYMGFETRNGDNVTK